ncbi:BppU family phage baseplate upper protein [Clostridium perfringens]|uniref:BppU family phage baseplate upper protein n=1 Tax=Clostridium perfringens TaxID=1502 RepID=UPI001DF96339|nr:BppU family phage baseplate upper protein [Clostridium perfringens]
MSEIGLNINVDSYNNEGIKTIKGNNNAEIYKLYILKNKRRLNLVGKTVKLGYVMAGTTKGDIIEDLNITNAEQGEITLPITNIISKQDGVYSCQLAIYGADEFLEYTATFGLTVKANIFTKIAGEIENSKDLTYIERILEEATNISEELKSNIPVARQLNSDLENQNRILNENMDRANGVNNTLITTTEQSKVAATDAIEKKSQLESSITKAKEFIDGLDGSQDIPGMRMELTELQNGLKSNQSLEYSGSSITANDTLDGRTEGMKIKGRTLNNLYKANNIREDAGGKYILVDTLVKDEPKDRVVYIVNNTNRILLLNVYKINGGWDSNPIIRENSISKLDLTGKKLTGFLGMYDRGWTNSEADKELLRNTCIVLDREETYIPQKYFEGLKSFGDAEQEVDKYKISILSCGKNLFNINSFKSTPRANLNNGLYNTPKPLGSYSVSNLYSSENRDKLLLKPNTTYICSALIRKTNGNGEMNYLSIITTPKNSPTVSGVNGYWLNKPSLNSDFQRFIYKFTTRNDVNVDYFFAFQVTQETTNLLLELKEIQIEQSEKFESYQEYKEDKKDVLIKEPLRGFDENTCDVMYEDNGQVKINRKIGSYIFNGNEDSWHLQSINEHGIANFQMAIKNVRGRIALCNRLVQQSTLIAETTTEGFHISEDNAIYIRLKETTANNVEQFKTWLSNNHINIISDLIKSSTEDVENCVDIDLDTYQEKTYFNILNSIPGTLDFKVPSNIGSLVQSNAKEINNINEFINNFILKALLEMNKDLAAIKIKNGLN